MAWNDTRVVLVRPHYAGNLGATARVMHNFGLTQLVLAAPVADRNDREARKLSTHAEFILDQAKIAADLKSAVADCTFVAATSANVAGVFRDSGSYALRTGAARFASSLVRGRGAIVFGPEPSGLTNDEVNVCHALLHIPTESAYRSFNLGQAVGITLYEFFCAQSGCAVEDGGEALASHDEQERMFAQLREGLEAVHFLYGPKADSLMHGLRHLLGRADLTSQEVKFLLGLSRQLMWIANRTSATD